MNTISGQQYQQEVSYKKDQDALSNKFNKEQFNYSKKKDQRDFAFTKDQTNIGNLRNIATDLQSKVNSDAGLKNNLVNIWRKAA